jgi:hypothetical protein
MAYLGREPLGGEVILIDSIESQFNGVLTTFNLTRTVSGVTSPFYPVSTQQLLVSLGGVIQKPDPTGNTGFKISFDTIIFAVAPVSGASCFIVSYGNITDIGTPADGTVTPTKLSAGGIYWDVNGNIGIGTNNPQGNLHVSSGTSGDCKLILESDTDNSNESDNPIIIFRQDGGGHDWSAIGVNVSPENGLVDNNSLVFANSASGFAGIIFKTNNIDIGGYTNAIERLRITPSGNIGIGATNPTTTLDVRGNFSVKPPSYEPGVDDSSTDIRYWNSIHDADIYSLHGGSVFGTIIEGCPFGHFTFGLRENDGGDAFTIISGGGNYTTDNTYDKIIATFRANGTVGIGTYAPAAGVLCNIDDNSTTGTVALSVTGGGEATNIAEFTRDIGVGTAIIKTAINGGGSGAQMYFENPTNIFSIGSENVSGSFHITDDTYIGSANTRFTINSSGNIGIGSTEPTTKLDVAGTIRSVSTSGNLLTLESTVATGRSTIKFNTNGRDWELGARGSSGDPDNTFYLYDNTASQYVLVANGSGNIGIGTNLPEARLSSVTTDSTLPFKLRRTDAAAEYLVSFGGGDCQSRYSVNGIVSYAIGIDDADGDKFKISYGSENNAAVGTNDYFVIQPDGNIGIGSTDPNTKLEVVSTTEGEVFRSRIKGSTNNPMIRFLHYESSGYSEINANGSTANALNLAFSTGSTERLRLTQSGNFGIGTTNPSHKLQVIGNVGIGTIISINPYDTVNGGTLSFEASSGQLFSVTNSLSSGSIFSVNDISGMPSIDVDADGTVQIAPYNGNVGIGKTNPSTALDVNGTITGTTKNFLINHPTQPGKKLRHGSLEGPENAVYVRGKLTNANTIELPEYWTGLVDENSITVSLTPIGINTSTHTVLNIENNTITIGSDSGIINCFYIIFGERKDVEKMEIVSE